MRQHSFAPVIMISDINIAINTLKQNSGTILAVVFAVELDE